MFGENDNRQLSRTGPRWLTFAAVTLVCMLLGFLPSGFALGAVEGGQVDRVGVADQALASAIVPTVVPMLEAQENSRLLLSSFLEGLEQPVFMTFARDRLEGDRLYVVERAGRIRIVQDGRLLDEPFLDIRDRVATSGESGLLSMAFPDDFTTSGVFYVYYNALVDLAPPTVDGEPNGTCDLNSGCDSVVARFRLSENPNKADPNSEEQLLLVNQPYANHNGGQITFGPDGYLYIGLGDGGRGGDPHNLAQNLESLLGKMLRIKVESTGTYSIPDTNPYTPAPPSYSLGAGRTSIFPTSRQEIWALGLRNPWRFSFDRSTGDLYIADVGQNAYEEVNFQPVSSTGGENYGWKILEGNHCTVDPCSNEGYVLPIIEYSHSLGSSITGGYIYRGTNYPLLDGVYLYGDWAVGKIWGAERDGESWSSRLLLDTGLSYSIVSFAEDSFGELYVIDLNGAIYRIVDLASLHGRPTQLRLPIVMNE